MTGEANPPNKKISSSFSARLTKVDPDTLVRAIVVLEPGAAVPAGGRASGAPRRAIIEAVRESASSAFGEIDEVLERFGGRRMSPGPNALGSIRVEAPPEGIRALGESDRVRAVMEDQPITGLTSRRRRTSSRG